MKKEMREALEEAGIDIEMGIERFIGNEELFIKFLKKFPEDICYKTWRQAREEKDNEKLFMAIHTMKGVAGNLSMVTLHDKLVPYVEALRAGDIEDADQLVDEVEEAYQTVVEVIKDIGLFAERAE